MPDSAIKNSPPPNPKSQEDQNLKKTQNRLCDFCGESVALLFCRADSAKLCFACDLEVHSTNPLFTKHTRWQLCDSCDSSPASIFCFTHRSVLCQNCDFELHSSLTNSPVHDRRALEGFNGCPSVSQLSIFLGFEDCDPKFLFLGDGRECVGVGGGVFVESEENDDGVSDLLAWDTPAIFSIDELIVSTDKNHNFEALGVPPLPKDRNFSCGKHKQDILDQLRKLAKLEPNLNHEAELVVGNQFMAEEDSFVVHDIHEVPCLDSEQIVFSGHEASSYPWFSDGCNEAANEILLSSTLFGGYIEESVVKSEIDLASGCDANLLGNVWHPHNANMTEPPVFSPKIPGHEFNTVDRDSALSRYKEKKRTRRYDKHISASGANTI
ncbi:hypothetical protein Nepgr_032856 [Nepenthes gracilis]|uniref:B box-type domain-containing protein n=1 Tax=Nepenthes gracilis TaxID=150966 RepID=A0AAD3TL74_NEPGR|nr:hypothetical protein Nepgr_032856 [Nepenthes gracilis]